MEDSSGNQQNKSDSKTSTERQDSEPYPSTSTEISSGNKSSAEPSIKYEYDDTLEIKEEIVPDQETATSQKINKEYELELCTIDTREAENEKNEKIQESKQEPEKTYKCEKCARSYKHKKTLNSHQKYECDVIPQFSCQLCNKRFKRKTHLKWHIGSIHQKKNLHTSQPRHNCDMCSRSYTLLRNLNLHKRSHHTAVQRQLICDYCNYKTIMKSHLSKHITSRHFK